MPSRKKSPVAAFTNDTAASSHFLDCPVVGGSQRNKRNLLMNHTDGWMNDGWMGGGMWIWTVIAVVIVALLVVMIGKLSKKK